MPVSNPETNVQEANEPPSNPEEGTPSTNGEDLFSEPEDVPNEDTPPSEPRQEEFSGPEDSQSTSDQSEIDSDESTDSEGEPRSEEEADPASDSGAEADQTATSEQEGDEASSEESKDEVDEPEETGDDEPFFDGEHSVYDSEEDALQGIEEKDRYIMELQENLESVEEEATERVQSLQSELDNVKQERNRLKAAVDDETVENVAIQDYLPERFQGKTEADFADDEELVEFKQAKLDAKAQLKHEREKQQREEEELQQEIQKRHEQAKDWVEDNVSAEQFGATSPERQSRLENFLESEEGEYTPLQKAQFVTAAFGEDDGRRFLQGLQAEFSESGSVPTPKNGQKDDDSHKESGSEVSSDEEVAEQVKKSKSRPDTPNENPRVPDNDMDDRTEMEEGFRRGMKENDVPVR